MVHWLRNFPGGPSGKESACRCRRHKRPRFNLWVRKIPWSGAWQPTPVFLPGESHGQRSLTTYSPQGWEESDTTERLTKTLCSQCRAPGLDPWSGNLIPHAATKILQATTKTWHSQINIFKNFLKDQRQPQSLLILFLFIWKAAIGLWNLIDLSSNPNIATPGCGSWSNHLTSLGLNFLCVKRD